MSFHETGLIAYVQFFWVVIIYFLVWLILRRIKPSLKTIDWQHQTKIAQIKPRGNVITLLKIYSKIIRSTPREVAVNVRDELTGNAALLFNKPNAFFVKYRSNDKIMSEYFEDNELRLFFKDPRYWALINGGVKTSFFGLVRDENSPSEDYYNNLNRILSKFEISIAGGKKTINNIR